jgi:3-oxoacyl-[acyl-carrier protein] reductase
MINKTIVLTGASDGIGKQIALRLAKEDARLILIARNQEGLQQTATEVANLTKSSVSIYPCDLRKNDEIHSTVDKIAKDHKSIDCLINDAGIWQKMDQLDNIPEKDIIDVIQTNMTGLILLTQQLLPAIRQSDAGSIINVISRSGYAAQEGQSVYTASKYGVKGFTEVLRQDLKNSNVRVAGIFQGGTNTNMFKKAGESIPDAVYASFIPPEGIADVIAYMLNLPKNVWLPEVKIETK